MTQKKAKRSLQEIKGLIEKEEDCLRPLINAVLQEILEAEMREALGAEKSERVQGRLGYRSGYYVRSQLGRFGPVGGLDRTVRLRHVLWHQHQCTPH